MKIFVCIKQVPATSEVAVDEETGVLQRSGVASKMNPFDLFALETALRLKEAGGGSVTVGTMGPPQAREIIQEAFMMGADEGYLFSDRRLAGADVLATSYTLSQAIRSLGDYDLILCGKQTTDGDTAQVGPAIAEHLNIPHASWVSALDLAENGVQAEQQLQDTVQTAFLPFPCLITVEQDIHVPRLPSMRLKKETRDREIPVLDLSYFMDQNEAHYGLAGSPTQVERIFPPRRDLEHELITEGDLAQALYDRLRAWKIV